MVKDINSLGNATLLLNFCFIYFWNCVLNWRLTSSPLPRNWCILVWMCRQKFQSLTDSTLAAAPMQSWLIEHYFFCLEKMHRPYSVHRCILYVHILELYRLLYNSQAFCMLYWDFFMEKWSNNLLVDFSFRSRKC